MDYNAHRTRIAVAGDQDRLDLIVIHLFTLKITGSGSDGKVPGYLFDKLAKIGFALASVPAPGDCLATDINPCLRTSCHTDIVLLSQGVSGPISDTLIRSRRLKPRGLTKTVSLLHRMIRGSAVY